MILLQDLEDDWGRSDQEGIATAQFHRRRCIRSLYSVVFEGPQRILDLRVQHHFRDIGITGLSDTFGLGILFWRHFFHCAPFWYVHSCRPP